MLGRVERENEHPGALDENLDLATKQRKLLCPRAQNVPDPLGLTRNPYERSVQVYYPTPAQPGMSMLRPVMGEYPFDLRLAISKPAQDVLGHSKRLRIDEEVAVEVGSLPRAIAQKIHKGRAAKEDWPDPAAPHLRDDT